MMLLLIIMMIVNNHPDSTEPLARARLSWQVSYQMAKSYHVPVRGVFLASQGYMFRRARLQAQAILTKVRPKTEPAGSMER
jgi:hypothetical protein